MDRFAPGLGADGEFPVELTTDNGVFDMIVGVTVLLASVMGSGCSVGRPIGDFFPWVVGVDSGEPEPEDVGDVLVDLASGLLIGPLALIDFHFIQQTHVSVDGEARALVITLPVPTDELGMFADGVLGLRTAQFIGT
ncbi:hypothetical protein C0995_000708 [Termitomyces sp. Mi166|nr:hypothetical protein C0995_000708 [Termitomyces sp. Mi166\